ncbi:DMT family transporter [Citromicrobium sp. WPS32]|uniref:DMT family transporter n=1 Tax=Citromicrobium sp. WPS32 TaxID=1634517 RepID=UPI0006C936E3|nr:DMT family transporter [Citromicrobium sp. WPS32]KPM15686.1 transporter [Citromicrobium sp. WPS32]MAY77872.1 EamA/RhaT family transporter [Citromicrobium sp.]|tara:strand:+ start:820 stop:1764 length:945 start_codon:yes stop_codon:yes gene_type:complete
MDASVAQSRPLTAIGLRLLAAFSLTTLSMLVKLVGEDGVHLLEIIFWRQAVTLLAMIAFAAATVGFATLRPVRFRSHAIRSAYGIVGMALVYGAVIMLPLAEATTINFTAPIWAVILSMLLMKERIGRYRWSAIAIGFAGILIVAQPGGNPVDPLGIAVGLGGAFMVALTSIQIQDLNKTESPTSIVFWFCLLTVPLLALALPFVAKAHSSETWLLLGGVGLSGAAAQLLLTTSLRFGSAATVIVMDYTALLWATLYGWQVFDELPVPNTWIGAPLIILAGTIILVREGHLARKARRARLDVPAPEEPLAQQQR